MSSFPIRIAMAAGQLMRTPGHTQLLRQGPLCCSCMDSITFLILYALQAFMSAAKLQEMLDAGKARKLMDTPSACLKGL